MSTWDIRCVEIGSLYKSWSGDGCLCQQLDIDEDNELVTLREATEENLGLNGITVY